MNPDPTNPSTAEPSPKQDAADVRPIALSWKEPRTLDEIKADVQASLDAAAARLEEAHQYEEDAARQVREAKAAHAEAIKAARGLGLIPVMPRKKAAK